MIMMMPTDNLQRRGRTGRKAAGSVVILAANDTIDTRHLYASKRRVERMKESLSSINAVLRPVKRAFLEPNPMTAEELAALEAWKLRAEERLRKEVAEEIGKRGPVETVVLDAEVRSRVQQLRRKAISVEEEMLTGTFQREVERAARRIHTELAKAGVRGADVELLREYLTLDYPVLNEALKKLEKLRRLAWRDEDTVVLADNLAPAKGDVYSIRVEKVMQGRAVVMVNKT
jgi:hypothetical protein